MLASYEAGLKQGDRLAAIRAGHAFHTIFIEASGNSELLRVTLDRRSLIARFILLRGKSSISRSGLRQHEAILQAFRSEEHTSELQSLMRISYAVFCLKKKIKHNTKHSRNNRTNILYT